MESCQNATRFEPFKLHFNTYQLLFKQVAHSKTKVLHSGLIEPYIAGKYL
jgi:hypothetical protein